MNSKKSNTKIRKIDLGLEINRAFMDDDMNRLFNAISTYMYLADLKVSSELIMKLSEDGLISPADPKEIQQWPYKSGDD